VTKIRLPLASVTNEAKRVAIWGLLREVASVADPARADVDLQMMGLEFTITARAGDLDSATAKARSIGAAVTVEADEM
jgi:hypothetical protein